MPRRSKPSASSSTPPAASRDSALQPYWCAAVEAWSRRLWLPSPADAVASSVMPRSTWFTQRMTHQPPPQQRLTISSPPTSRPSTSKSTSSEKKKEGDKRKVGASLAFARKKRKIEGLMRAMHIRVYPNAKQKNIMKQWIGCARLVYNSVVEAYRAGSHHLQLGYFRHLRNHRINDGTWAFMAGVPYNVLDEAVKEAIQARDLVLSRNQEEIAVGRRPSHRLSFRSRKEPRQTIAIREQNCFDNIKFYPRILHIRAVTAIDPRHPRRKDPTSHPPLHHEHRKRNHNWPNLEGRISCDSKLTWDRSQGQWTFVWVYEKPRAIPHENQVGGVRVCSLDPGVRTFLTW